MPLRKQFFTLIFSLTCFHFVCADARGQDGERERAAAEIESLREQIRAREATLLAPSREDIEAHAEFLSREGTGLLRLLPREKWDGKLSMRGGGAYYSFTRRVHEYGYGSDIELQQGRLSVGFAGADFGFMLDLGDVPLETISAEADALQLMASFKTPSAETEARQMHRRFAQNEGAREGRWTYSRSLPAVAGHTYALRSVNYERSDVLVAFRILRRDSDGSVVLLWKILEQYPKPTLRVGEASSAPK